LFSRAYPEELSDPYDLHCILNFLSRHEIGISDVIRKGRRKRSTSGDSDLEVLEYNLRLRERVMSGKVKTVVCTGGNHPRGVMGIFLQKIMNVKTSTHTKDANTAITLSLPEKELRVYRIPSPSGAANRGIAASKDYKAWKTQSHQGAGIDDYKVYMLRRVFDPIILRKISP
jgi:G:T/U-mismatch repair DNA glycosylase